MVVQASDGGTMDEQLSWFKVAVTVTDEEEDGKVTWTVDHDGGDPHTPTTPKLMQFQAGASLMASVTDDDGPDPLTNVRWQWYRSSSKTSMGTEIDGATSATYVVSDTSTSNDVGMYLRAMATYSDRRGPNKTASLVSDYPVQAARKDNSVPEFPSSAATRSIPEGASGRDVGAPVTATDADNDMLNYHISGGADEASFKIDQKTGQITTAMTLDFSDDGGGPDDDEYEIEVTATDSAGGVSNPVVTVTITVSDVNEAPTFSAELTGMATDHTEGTTAITGATYTATDPEGANVELSLSGDDKDMFELSDPDPLATPPNYSKVLSFKSKPYFPDFENPEDANEDNIYEVTVVATDGSGMTAMRSLTVKVVDTDEMGMVELSSQDALIGVELTATLKDSDGGVPDPAKFTGVTWVWERDVDTENAETNTGDEEVISGATSASYTPVAGDRGMHLRAIAMYTDRTYDEDNDDNTVGMSFMNTAVSDSTTPVRNNPANQAPKFGEGASTFRVVEENTMALMGATGQDDADDDDLDTDNVADNVGEPVTATDDDDDTPTYTLSGTDAAMFRIRSDGQIEVGAKAKLDYEKKNRYSVKVIADDGYGGGSNSTAEITVTIHVTDLDEAPEIMDRADRTAIGEQSVTYKENDDKPVLTLMATDPEGVTPIDWSILESAAGTQDLGIVQAPADDADDVDDADVADHASFGIKDGVLTFESPPSYEDNSLGATYPGITDDSKTYRVVVQASDGGTMDEQLSWFKVAVTVTDEEEDGKVTWTVDHDGGGADTPKLMQFQAGAILTASVEDDDGTTSTERWQWYRSSSKTSMGTAIDGATSAIYTATDSGTAPDEGGDDRGKYIHVKATYKVNSGDDETATLVSDYPVRAIRAQANSVPVFSDTAITRRVTEGASGRAVGAPVTATDADKDVLNYHISGGADATSFKIDQKTGQITTDAVLNFSDDADSTASDDDYVIEVRATDSAGGLSAPVVIVTITVTDVNEDPTFSAGPEGMAADHTEGMTVIDAEPADGDQPATYTATDPEGANVELSLSGDDKDMFELASDTDTGAGATQVLSFMEMPDFETPADADGDNIYEVTVVATDGSGMTAMRSLTVKVIDTDEAGMVELSSQDALIGVELTATLTDSDGGVPDARVLTGVEWTWHQLDSVDEAIATSGADDNRIKDATSDTYTPVAADRGKYLKARATYTDRTYDEDNNANNNDAIEFMTFMNTADSDSTTPVRNNPMNQAPKFDEGESTFRVVEENTMAVMADPDEDLETTTDDDADNVGEPVVAEDDADDTPTYSLSGADAAMFRIRSNGQIEVGDKAMLDYETKNRYMVTVTATDSSGDEANNSASIDVTIHVTDLDEAPMILVGALAISGQSRADDYLENGTNAVATYMASGPNADSAGWSLEGADAGAFTFDTTSGASVMLSFSSPPDYENPADADEDNTYMVTLKADDGTYMDDQAVIVMVTNLEELGTLSGPEGVIDDYAENGTGAVGTYSTDGPVDAIWSLEGDDAGDFDISQDGMLSFTSSPNYEDPADADTDNTYMVTVKAEAGGESDTAMVTINVTDMNDAPMFADDMAERSVAENTVAGENVGDPVMAMDEDADDTTLTYTLGGVDADSFTIDAATGQISVGEGTELDFESEMTTYTVTVTATDGDGLEDVIAVTVNVTNVNDHMPMFAEDTAMREVAENAAAGTYVGDPVTATDADDDSLMYSDDSKYFDVDPETGQIMVAEGAMLDHEMEDMHTVTVTASDGEDSDSIMVTIMVTDMNEAPMFAADMDTRSVAENTAAGENVGDPVMAMDEDEGDTLTYALGGDDAASFMIDGETGQISVGEGTELDFESDMTTYTVTVTATDGDGLYDMITVTITVTNVNEQPMFADDVAEFSVAENAAAGTDVGMVMASDGDDILMFSDDSMYFDVDSETGQIVVAEGAMLDYEMEDMHTVTVTASDGEDTGSIIVTITVTDMYPACGTQGGDAANMYLNNDCEALLDSKDALGGSLNWDEDMPINDWDGIQGHSMFPSLSGDPMRVTALHLQKGDLDGMIPDALGRLSALTYLNAHSNTLSGMVPGALGMLTNLERLYLNNNQLDGSIGDLSGATSLEILWLKSNQLTGGIPSELGSLSNLKELRLFNNPDLGGEIPMELGSLSSLTLLVVQDTGLSGEIPMELGNLSNLMWLGLYNNELSGTIPMELGSLSNLEVLYLHYNQLTGEIPDELGNLAALTNLWLKSNLLTGDIPSSLGDLTNLERVRFSRNPGLTGCVPAGLAAVADNDFNHLGLPTCQ